MKPRCTLHRHRRTTDGAHLDAITQFQSSVIADSLGRDRRHVALGLHAIPSGFRDTMVGTALTVSVAAGDNLMLQKALDVAQPGDIVVCDCGDQSDRAVAGEMLFRYAASRGIAGMVIDGSVRDAEFLRSFAFPVYAKDVSPLGPTKSGSGSIGLPIEIGGAQVRSGDYLVGDVDGVVVIPHDRIEETLAGCHAVVAKERAIIEQITAGNLSRKWIDDLVEVVEIDSGLPEPVVDQRTGS